MFLELPVVSFRELIHLKTCPRAEFSARSTRWSGQLQRALVPTWEGEWKQGLWLQLSAATSPHINWSCCWNQTLKLTIPKSIFCATNLVSATVYQNFPGCLCGNSCPIVQFLVILCQKNEVFSLNLIHQCLSYPRRNYIIGNLLSSWRMGMVNN